MILEATFVIDFLKGRNDAVSKMESLVKENILVSIAAPTVFELFAGYEQHGKGEREKQKISLFLKTINLFPLDGESAKIGGIIDGALIKKGLQIDAEDSMIAGIAMAKNESVLTRDSHFDRIEGLKVEKY